MHAELFLISVFIYVTLEHKTSHKSRGIFVASQKYIAWIKIVDFLLCQKSLRY